MYTTSIEAILNAMSTYGGSFVQQLSVLYRHGDANNRRILESAFSDYFLKYDKIASERPQP